MGLRERQLIKKHQEETLPKAVSEATDISGGGIFTWEIDWDSFAPSEYALINFESSTLEPIVSAIRNICYNDYGREAVRTGLRRIVVHNVDTRDQKQIVFFDGTLTIHGSYVEGQAWGAPGSDELQRILEDGL